ncbi:elongation factor P hydroxylase [Gilvimarinus algae]|uniref:Elongation factor P hydroxylase n=1 Tax=Gilvimarinus algae TaxID=3058037 RepID=A0ABT8T8X6_9GAMM|nr:elongation factor P hydroxylase [Gilvimarinus sp. SDUM040014]MDO3380581.1 elongation factor P hydroxylase [Gilvimarinus sp. SDUM040014]
MTAVARTCVHDCRDLIALFNRCFAQSEVTLLVGGAPEPVYLPCGDSGCAEIHFTRDYFASALHEIAHWCVAGRERRQLEDYGYWYAPDGRSAEQQAEFEAVEARPQALEWLFSEAAGVRFRVSADNLAQNLGPSEAFKQAVHARVLDLCTQGVSERVAAFTSALLGHYRPELTLGGLLSPARFARASL